MPQECTVELKANQSHALAFVESRTGIESVLDPTKFSTLSRLLRVTIMVCRAIKVSHVTPEDSMKELQEVELLWVKSAQKTLVDLKTLTKQFTLFQDDCGVWRCGGRLANSEIPFATKFPILLPESSCH